MTTLSKDQQQFWNILKMPYDIVKACGTCSHVGPGRAGSRSCRNPNNRRVDDATCWAPGRRGNPYKDQPSMWEWDGKSN